MFESVFIALDGPDGCGKSTQAKLLAEHIESLGVKVQTFRDPGSTAIGEKIRDILLDAENSQMSDRTELLLYMACRAQLYEEAIAPALNKKHCVIIDRWLSSTCAYQGCAGGVGMETVLDIAGHSLTRVWPDLTIILDVDLSTSAARMVRDLDRMEQKGDSYHEKVRQGFLSLAELRDDIVVIEASADIQAVHKKVVKTVNDLL